MILSWYALFSYQVGSRNVEFALAHPSADWRDIAKIADDGSVESGGNG